MTFIKFLNQQGYPETLLNDVLSNKEKYIYNFKIKGKWQVAPRWELKILQKILKDYIYTQYNDELFSSNATAYLKNKNISYNLERHQGNNYFFVSDFKNFFPSILQEETKKILKNSLYKENDETLNYVYEIAFFRSSLQYGFPSSPIISNVIMKKFDDSLQDELQNIIPNLNIQYTRYSDDLTISSKYKVKKELLKEIINKKLEEYSYLKLNEKKTRYFEKFSKKPYITGLVPLNQRTSIGKKKYNQLKLNIYLILNEQKILNKNFYKTEVALKSYLSYVYLVDKHNYNRLRNFYFGKYSKTKLDKIFSK